MADHRIGQQVAFQVVHNLTYVDHELPIWPRRELYRFDMRINHRPLAGPIISYARTPVNMTAFHAICPHHVFVHCRKHALHISSIETVVKTSQMFLLHIRNLAGIRQSQQPRTLLVTYMPCFCWESVERREMYTRS